MVWLIDNLLRLFESFTTVALTDPLSAALLFLGAVLTVLPVLVGVYLLAGAVGDLFTPA